MDFLFRGLAKAIELLVSLDREVVQIAWLTVCVSGASTLIALALGMPLGVLLALRAFFGRRLLMALVNTGMGLPPVVVGLFVAILLWRSGPLGGLNLIYTPTAMVIAQVIIALPIVAGVSMAALQQVDPMVALQARALGASRWQALWAVLQEARLPLLAAIMAAFGSVVSEVGAVLMVGGNLKGDTRVLTTAIVLETRMGRLEMAIALAILLLVLSFAMNLVLTRIQQKGTGGAPFRCWR
ncbi:MAG TPA: ABC transporter permease [Planctomycetota bacterium]|nr:ABC transporter permease [Planctomycetota bacterium]HRR79063.1 ABC transporter permease [Planctomycetota bacterium]HRT93013.1 ABC transporter permease [Planctomycetota bacterium]